MSYETMQYEIVKKHYFNKFDLMKMILEKNWFNSDFFEVDVICNFLYNYTDSYLDETSIKDMANYIFIHSDFDFIDKSVSQIIVEIIDYLNNNVRVDCFEVDVDDLPI